MTRRSKTPPLYGRSATESLHTLKDDWGCQASYLGEQCDELLAHLPAAIQATCDASPMRSPRQPFNPDGSQRKRKGADQIDPSNKERRLEAEIWKRWRFDGPLTGEEPTLWVTLVGMQVPLFDNRHRRGWGHVDLLGIDKAGAPVIVELKKGDNKEVPLRPVLEVVAYAIALRKNWEPFAGQLREQLKEADRLYTPCTIDAPFPCVVLAPSFYWQQWAPDGKRGKAVGAGPRAAFRKLLGALGERGYPVTFGRVDTSLTVEVCSFAAESP